MVLVTGGTGYIAGYVIHQLLKRGFHVRTTVRNLKTNKKLKCIKKGFGVKNCAGTIQIIEANLKSDKNWDLAAKGCKYVIHLASPVDIFRRI